MYKRLIDRFGAKALSVGVVVAMLGGGAALALPDVAVEGMNEAAENREAAALDREDPPADAGEDEPREEDLSDPVLEEPEVEESEVEATKGEGEGSESDDRRGPPEEVREFLEELHTWIACIQEGARAHADQQSDPDTRIEDDEYDETDKFDLCGDKPTNPNDTHEEGENDKASENNGEGGDRGRPEGAGPPDWAGGPPEWAGPPDGAGGPPSGAGGPGR